MVHSVPVMHTFTLSASTVASLRKAIADSISTRQCIMLHVDDLENCIRFIGCHYDDCDFDPFPNAATIFGDDPSIPGEDGEYHFVLHLTTTITNANPYAE